MQLVLHTGVHHTEEERLVRCLIGNKDVFSAQGVAVPRPRNYRTLIRDTLNAMHKTPASPQAREVLIDALLEDRSADRVILSDPNFFRSSATAVQDGVLYPAAAVRMARMAQLFPDDRIEIFIAIRNPATLLPLLREDSSANDDAAFWGECDPLDIRWSDTVGAIRDAVPDVPITLWCNEDAPLLWGQIMRDMAGLASGAGLSGVHDLLETIMSREGMQRLRTYEQTHPDMPEQQSRRVVTAFLDKYAIPDALVEELDMPGWTDELVERMTQAYDADVAVMQGMSGVTVILP